MSTSQKVIPGITPAGKGTDGTVWSILGHTYYPKNHSEGCFAFETYDPPGTFVPPHVHPTQDEFIYVLDGTYTLYLDGEWTTAGPGDLVRMPRGIPHAYYNRSESEARSVFWVSPSGKLPELFGLLHDLQDPEEVVRLSAQHDVDFLPPGSVEGA